MNEVLGATWVILFAGGLLSQLLSPARYGHKSSNQYGAFVSFMLLLNAIPLGYAAFGALTGTVLAVGSLYLLVNAWILSLWRFHALRTRQQVMASASLLGTLMGVYFIIDSATVVGAIDLAVASCAFSVLASMAIIARTRAARMDSIASLPELSKVPTVTFAVPARNETHALTKHLKSISASDYPKLEILVADDCSQDDTAQIIRSFAHDGVRFVQGHTPAESWVGKNQAYQLLADEASGEYIVFSGVDTRYKKETITDMLRYMKAHDLHMISFLPRHEKVALWSMVIQPIRYMLMLVGASTKTPSVLSTVWVIKRSKLKKYGGFAAVENSIVPEQYFARRAGEDGGYKFLIGTTELGVSTFKKPSSQRETAIRYLYPRLRKQVANHALFTVAMTLVIAAPVGLVVHALFTQWNDAATLGAVSLATIILAHAVVVQASYTAKYLVLAPFYLIVGSIYMYWLSIVSMISYELDSVIWKGRNVCYPVMMNSLGKK